ncbi:MAG: hypothetical protein PHP53_15315 [Prolixibacteraceae bacterium]|nr:hypothetical protein [Prolixibacteraceae bacterium]
MEKYSCFICPNKDYSKKELFDVCTKCGLTFGFPLEFYPEMINNIRIIKPLARGFYGATYIGEIAPLGKLMIKKVIKVIPVELYKFHNKNFREESENHLELSENSNHVVGIDTNIFFENLPITFTNGITINCHVIGLEYLEGKTLKEYLNQDITIPSRTIAQISIDLISLLQELKSNKKYHNDLHPGNIIVENLPTTRIRFGEIDENIRVVAIDLGSLDQKTKSNDDSDRVGDLHWIAQCLYFLSRKITDNIDKYEDKDWRLAFLLEEKADFLKPEVIHQRQITYTDLINQIKDTYYHHTSPWKQEFKLKSFDDAVNAQSLSPWYVTSLFVDKDNAWTKSISIKGPQVITGMRGCGKTMLLRALEFHARLMPQNSDEEINNKKIIERLTDPSEKYVGLYISCVKLLDFNALDGDVYKEIFEPYSKLLIGYTIQALHTIRHLKDLQIDIVRKDYFITIANTLSSLINNSQELLNVTGDYDLEIRLKKYLNSLSDGQSTYQVTIHPKIAFPQLAESIKKSSEIFAQSNIYFLLDDVSTRYLNDRSIIKLISELLFQDETCAFKFTTEAQTLEMVIMAPGSNSQAKIGRDYSIFDLGAEVNRVIREDQTEGRFFVESILLKRAKYFPLHPKNSIPSQILGDESLISIAESIVREEKASLKKELYHGISALTAVCVGDLGDVITLYELILRRSSYSKFFPIEAKIQNSCYLELCNSRLYDLNRRNTRYLDFVESFADASHHLLIQSALKKARGETDRLRQYASIFINITVGDKENQYKQVRQLIDAGIFNLQGGPEASRTNRQGLKPQQQFKLVFRKLYGVSKHMALSNSDRFEISGKALEEWLSNPKNGKTILTKNLNPFSEIDIAKILSETDFDTIQSSSSKQKEVSKQLYLFDEPDIQNNETDYSFILEKLPEIKYINQEEDTHLKIDVAIIGLGFEEAALNSAIEIKKINPQRIIFIELYEKGLTNDILKVFDDFDDDKKVIIKQDLLKEQLSLLENCNVLCDITGLPKGILFDTIRTFYLKNKNLYISLTTPEKEYPLDEDVQRFMDSNGENDSSVLLGEMSNLLNGEKGPYSLINLFPHYVNISEPRVLFAFASAKHERLYTLLDEREFEQINVIVTNGDAPRDKLARTSAEFSLRKFNSAVIHYLNQNDIDEILQQITKDYYTYFIQNNFPFELGLTGNKIQTAAAAIFSAIFKISQCWYVKPEKWDTERYSKGSKDFLILRIRQMKYD